MTRAISPVITMISQVKNFTLSLEAVFDECACHPGESHD
jgi:hypothetical protein